MNPGRQAVPGCIAPELGAGLEDYLSGRLAGQQEQSFEEHYFSCEACLEEIRLRQALPRALSQPAHAAPAGGRRWLPAASVAAGVAALALAYPAWLGLVELPRTRDIASKLSSDQASMQATVQDLRGRMDAAETRLSSMAGWGDAASVVVLSSPSRSRGRTRVLHVKQGQPHAPMMVVPPDLTGMSPESLVDFSLTGPDGSRVWSRRLSVEEIRSRVAESGAVMFLLPSAILPDGSCRLGVREGSADGAELMTDSFEIAHEG